MASYGFMGDVMALSERLRWLGPPRYEAAGALRFLALTAYAADVWYVPAGCNGGGDGGGGDGDGGGGAPALSAASSSPPLRRRRSSPSPPPSPEPPRGGCFAGCGVCGAAAAVAPSPSPPSPRDGGWVRAPGGKFVSIKLVVTSCRSDKCVLVVVLRRGCGCVAVCRRLPPSLPSLLPCPPQQRK
jgi:hypothetical protein